MYKNCGYLHELLAECLYILNIIIIFLRHIIHSLESLS